MSCGILSKHFDIPPCMTHLNWCPFRYRGFRALWVDLSGLNPCEQFRKISSYMASRIICNPFCTIFSLGAAKQPIRGLSPLFPGFGIITLPSGFLVHTSLRSMNPGLALKEISLLLLLLLRSSRSGLLLLRSSRSRGAGVNLNFPVLISLAASQNHS